MLDRCQWFLSSVDQQEIAFCFQTDPHRQPVAFNKLHYYGGMYLTKLSNLPTTPFFARFGSSRGCGGVFSFGNVWWSWTVGEETARVKAKDLWWINWIFVSNFTWPTRFWEVFYYTLNCVFRPNVTWSEMHVFKWAFSLGKRDYF